MSERLLVISDIHGHRKALATLLKRAKYNPKKIGTYGDYVNNGPDSFWNIKVS